VRNLQLTINNFNKFKDIFTFFGKNYPDISLYQNRIKFIPKIYVSLTTADVYPLVMMSSKMPLSEEGSA